MRAPHIHIIGAGLAGLSAAVDLASSGARIFVHESAKAAGGRCRSYFDQQMGMEIDNGNHLLLSGNAQALKYMRMIGAEDRLTHASRARFPFVDLRNGRRWTIAPSVGPLPLWLLSAERRAPGANLREHMDMLKVIWASGDAPICQRMACRGPLYENMARPFLLAALNTDPAEASSALARQVMRETLAKGAAACRPIIAHEGLSHALIDPALTYLARCGAKVVFSTRLRALSFQDSQATTLHFDDQDMELNQDDLVILAIPAKTAVSLVPGLVAPDAFNAIVNAHYAIAPPMGTRLLTGIVGATSEWLFAYPNRLSVTISAANHLLARPLADLARDIWREVSQVAGLNAPLPSWRILREKHATFAATPEQNRRRPSVRSAYANLLLAGDWTATGLPATIEGAIKSGAIAANEARMQLKQRMARTHANYG